MAALRGRAIVGSMNTRDDMPVIPDPGGSLLLTDLYQLTMLQSYLEHGMTETAVFEFFVRKLPTRRGFLVAAGLEQAVEFLERAHFTGAELDWLPLDDIVWNERVIDLLRGEENGLHLVVVFLRDRIELVVVAARTADGHPQKRQRRS